MKKFFIVVLLMIGVVAFAGQPILVAHYSNGVDEVQTAISPLDGNLYMIINGRTQLVFVSDGMNEYGGFKWRNDSFGLLLFSADTSLLTIYEYSSGKMLTFRFAGAHTEILPG
jgi:hypothetical protein